MTPTHAFLLFTTVGAVSCVCACDRRPGAEPADVSVAQLAESLKSGSPPAVYDANGDRTRREYGVIPGSFLLPSCSSYPLDVLPADKNRPLVFYCASSWCGAAEDAAERALRAGYASVKVLPDGIKGWSRAGLPTETVN